MQQFLLRRNHLYVCSLNFVYIYCSYYKSRSIMLQGKCALILIEWLLHKSAFIIDSKVDIFNKLSLDSYMQFVSRKVLVRLCKSMFVCILLLNRNNIIHTYICIGPKMYLLRKNFTHKSFALLSAYLKSNLFFYTHAPKNKKHLTISHRVTFT